jgi:hypothetical protein
MASTVSRPSDTVTAPSVAVACRVDDPEAPDGTKSVMARVPSTLIVWLSTAEEAVADGSPTATRTS